MKSIKGYSLISASVLAFSLMVIVSKQISLQTHLPASELTLVRFLVSFLIILVIKWTLRKTTTTHNLRFLLDRGVSNFVAVYLFFLSITMISATKANLYNMTYPIFVGLLSPFVLAEKFNLKNLLYTLLCFGGVGLVINPAGPTGIHTGDLVGIASGLVAGYAVVSLKRASTYDNAFTILYYHMGIGLLLSALLCLPQWITPPAQSILPLLAMSLFSLLGQYFITAAYHYLGSVQGAIWSSARIFVVAGLGILFLGDKMSLPMIIGSGFIIASIILINREASG